ncbi:phage recombination protein Bet [Microcoleus sp. bin38.metabat.b11b12b14.051]|uniref:phage recombination protein Bet n=1 Tax=Microcoleus sp. bin38.metabat.b11b12b14.051 TaxID=2742709 RepID=UPI0025F31351|nr:phage recombination protein Bet [Microcoleus sp. bin38.metabat.b11b12b14.051]
MSQIVQVQPHALVFDTEEIRLIKSTILDERATNDELKLFSMVCQKTGLDPFSRQIYGIRRKGKLTFQTSIDGYRLIADRTNKYAGNDEATFDEGLDLYQHLTSGRHFPTTATVTVWKLCGGQRCPFSASAAWAQYAQVFNGKLGENWEKMPHLMLAKCAEALALRKAFPAELSGMYTREEMPDEGAENNVTQQIPEINKPQVKPIPAPVSVSPQQEQELELLHPVQQAIVKLRWTDKQEMDCLLVNFGKSYLTDLTNDDLLDLFDYLCNYNESSEHIKRLGWDADRGREHLRLQYGKEARHLLNATELAEFVNHLKLQEAK